MTAHRERTYRRLMTDPELAAFRVVVKETDLLIHARTPLPEAARELILTCRGHIERTIAEHPDFARTLSPWRAGGWAPAIVREMAGAGQKAGVGPMAAVAGAVAEFVGRGLLDLSDAVMVENGGDLFIRKPGPVTVGIYAGDSPLSLEVGVRLDPGDGPVSVCTSSGTVGHSLSMGRSDAVCVVSASASLADAVATAAGNLIQSPGDIRRAVDFARAIGGVAGVVAVARDRIAAWGDLEVVPLKGKKG